MLSTAAQPSITYPESTVQRRAVLTQITRVSVEDGVSYSTENAPQSMHARSTLVIDRIWSAAPSAPVHPRMPADAKVVANCAVGFGAPEIVTVGALGLGVGELELVESDMVNVEEDV